MATGPGGGSRQIGGAHVTLTVEDRQYYAKLSQAHRALQGWANQAQVFARAIIRIDDTQFQTSLRQNWVHVKNYVNSVNRDLGRIGGPDTLAGFRSLIAHSDRLLASLKDVGRAVGIINRAMSGGAFAHPPRQATAPGAGRDPNQSVFNRAARDAQKAMDDVLRASLRDAAATVRSQKRSNVDLARAARDAQKAMDDTLKSVLRDAAATVRTQKYVDRDLARAARDAQKAMDDALKASLMDARKGTPLQLRAGDRISHFGESVLQGIGRSILGARLSLDRFRDNVIAGLGSMAAAFSSSSIQGRGGVFQKIASSLNSFLGNFGSFGNSISSALGRIASTSAIPLARVAVSVTSSLNSFFTTVGTSLISVSHSFGNLSPLFNKFGTAISVASNGLMATVRGATSVGMTVVRGAMSTFVSVLITSFGLLASGLRSIANTVLGSVGAAFRNIGSLGALGAGVAGGFSLLYIHRQIVDMERELTRLRRTTGATAAEIEQLSRSFNDMGTSLAGVELNKILELAVMGARLGVPREQLNLFTRDLSKVAAVLEDIPIDEAATRFSGLISVFELQYTDTIKLASALNALDISSNAAARDILDIAGRMSGAASTIGLTAQQTLALATAMRQARVPIETAGTAMGQILGRMTGRELPEFARLAGMSTRAFQQLLGQDALAALVKVEQGLGRLSAMERFRALDQLHLDGQRVRLVMLQLVPVLDELGKYLGIANEEWRTTNSIMAGFRLQAETASAMFRRMWNNIQLVAVALGHALLPVMKGVSNAISNMAYDITEFLNQRGDKMRAWGERMARVFETLGAVTRVNWGDVGAVLMAAFNDLWGQIQSRVDQLWNQVKKNFFWLRDNVPTLASNAFGNLIAMATRAVMAVLPAIQAMITNAIMAVARAVVAALPAAIRGLVNVPALAPVAAGKIANPQQVPWLQGVQAPPGIGVPGLQMPGVLGMIPGMFGLGADQQRKDLVRRQALGALQDMVARFLGGRGGRGNADPGMGRLAALAAMQDAGEGAGGLPGGAGGGGGGAGGFGGFGQAMAGGGMGGVRPPLGPDPIHANRMALAMMALGLPGAPGLMARARHADLMAWRTRLAARRPQGAFNPWIGVRNQLMGRRNAIWMALAGNRHRNQMQRLDILRRTAVEQRRQQEIRNARLLGPGAPEWAGTAVGRIVESLGKIERAISIPVLD